MAGAYEEQINELNEEIENIQRDYDEQLIMIANDKQQVVMTTDNLHNAYISDLVIFFSLMTFSIVPMSSSF